MGDSAGVGLGDTGAVVGTRVLPGVGRSRGAGEANTDGTAVGDGTDTELQPLNAARVSINARMRAGITASFPHQIHTQKAHDTEPKRLLIGHMLLLNLGRTPGV